MARLGLETEIVDPTTYDKTIAHLREHKIALPTFAELADPERIPDAIVAALADIDPDSPHPLNLFRVHWHNARDRKSRVEVPEHVVLPRELTGVDSPILVAFGNRFPMIRAHKVLAAYGCLVPRLVTGQYDPTAQRAIWPSTGNYCRGGLAISRVLGCRGVAVLPEGMSRERFEWLEKWALIPDEDIVKTYGTESNVKEIYDKCAELDADPKNIIFNQFCEFGNHLVHYHVTGPALDRVYQHVREAHPGLELTAFVSATGSAGTIAAGDYLKDAHGTGILAAEALECPTMLENGYGEHNIQGIGDKHIPYIHNVMNTDYVAAISDHTTDSLNALFHTPAGRDVLLGSRVISPEILTALGDFGLSSLCNIVSAIQLSKKLGLSASQAVITVATDGAEMYTSEIDKTIRQRFGGTFGRYEAERVLRSELDEIDPEHLLVLDEAGRRRIFNLGYFTWVEQQGVALADFERRRDQSFWRELRPLVPLWDERIDAVNRETGARP